MTWLPRFVALAYILFLVVLSLDAFGGSGTVGEKLTSFMVHLAPAAAVAGFLVLAWRFRLIGGLFFMILGMVFTVYFHTDRSVSAFLMISMPLFLAGVLFIFSHSTLKNENPPD